MPRLFITIGILLLCAFRAETQTTIRGSVTDTKGNPLTGANVLLVNTYDGATTDTAGNYEFTTVEIDVLLIEVSYLGYKTQQKEWMATPGLVVLVDFVLREAPGELTEVVITAGAFEASEEKKSVILRPLDIVTTAGANGDFAGALNTLPGTTISGETGQLLVRGGAANETRTFIDGLPVSNFYTSNVPDVPARSRFSPFDFKGTIFSTGGYSAEYGQAMSAALILQTRDLPEKDMTSLGLMSVGLSAGRTKRWENEALSIGTNYTNLAPYMALVPQKLHLEKAPETFGGEAAYVKKLKSGGYFKSRIHGNHTVVSGRYTGGRPFYGTEFFGLRNDHLFSNLTYKRPIGKNWTWYAGGSAAFNQDNLETDDVSMTTGRLVSTAKSTLSYLPAKSFNLRMGAEYQFQQWQETRSAPAETDPNRLVQHYVATFAEADLYLSARLVARAGIRSEFDTPASRLNAAPRLSLAYKTGKDGQVSLAAGRFYQSPEVSLLRQNEALDFESADHFILNYQWLHEGRIFRVEGYYKQYHDLVTFENLTQPDTYANEGEGFARGVEVFYRDQKTLKNSDFWISYSWLDTRRQSGTLSKPTRPAFAAGHNVALVFKRYFPKWKLMPGITGAYNSGRPYDDPALNGVNESTTPPYFDLSGNVSYLTDVWGHFTILYASVTNITGQHQVFGYRYAATPDNSGIYDRLEVTPQAKRFFFVGIFVSINDQEKVKPENLF